MFFPVNRLTNRLHQGGICEISYIPARTAHKLTTELRYLTGKKVTVNYTLRNSNQRREISGQLVHASAHAGHLFNVVSLNIKNEDGTICMTLLDGDQSQLTELSNNVCGLVHSVKPKVN